MSLKTSVLTRWSTYKGTAPSFQTTQWTRWGLSKTKETEPPWMVHKITTFTKVRSLMSRFWTRIREIFHLLRKRKWLLITRALWIFTRQPTCKESKAKDNSVWKSKRLNSLCWSKTSFLPRYWRCMDQLKRTKIQSLKKLSLACRTV